MNLATLRTGRGDERGSILVLSGVGLVLALICTSLAVDLGMLAHEIRVNQKVADLAALDAARVLPADPNPAAQASALRNGFPTEPGYSVTAVEGVKVTSGGNDTCLAQPGAGTVCVTATSRHKNFFPFVADGQSKSRVAVAGPGNAIGTVRVGSTLASMSGSTPSAAIEVLMLNRTISALIGGNYSTNLVGWRGLAEGSVTFAELTSALATATGNGTFAVGTTEEVLDSTFTMGQLTTAMANVLNNNGNSSAATTVAGIGAQATGSQSVTLRRLLGIGSVVVGNKQDVANASLNVLDLIRGGAILADGDHFASFDLTKAEVPIPGVFNGATVSMGLIEGPRTSLPGAAGKNPAGEYYTAAHTSQIRVRLDVRIRVPLSGALTTTVGIGPLATTTQLLAAGTLVNATFSYYLDAGSAHAYLEDIRCAATAQPTSVDILGVTDVGTSKLGFVNNTNLGTTGTSPNPNTYTVVSNLAGLVNVKTTGVVTTSLPGNPGVTRTFLPPYTETSPSQPVPGTMVSLPTVSNANLTVDPVVVGLNAGTLISDLTAGINATGLVFTAPGTPGVASWILKPLYEALGLSFGSADLWAPPVQNCAALSPLGPIVSTNPPVLRG